MTLAVLLIAVIGFLVGVLFHETTVDRTDYESLRASRTANAALATAWQANATARRVPSRPPSSSPVEAVDVKPACQAPLSDAESALAPTRVLPADSASAPYDWQLDLT